MTALSRNLAVRTMPAPAQQADFLSYLEHSLRDPFTLNLHDCTLLEVVHACIKAKSKLHPTYASHAGTLVHNLKLLQEQYRVTLYPVQVTDVFWGYFISFLQERDLRSTSISTLCSLLRSVLNWAVKYNARVSPTYGDILIPSTHHQGVALTADEISRIAYFDIDLFYANRRKDFRATIKSIRDLFVLSCNLGQRYSDMVRIEPSCFERNIFRIVQQKTGNRAVVNIDKFAVEPKTVYRILEQYGYYAPYSGSIGNYNFYLHSLMRDIGLTDIVRDEELRGGKVVVKNIPKWKAISSHCGRRSFISVNVFRGHNIHDIKRCSGHTDVRSFEGYVCDFD